MMTESTDETDANFVQHRNSNNMPPPPPTTAAAAPEVTPELDFGGTTTTTTTIEDDDDDDDEQNNTTTNPPILLLQPLEIDSSSIKNDNNINKENTTDEEEGDTTTTTTTTTNNTTPQHTNLSRRRITPSPTPPTPPTTTSPLADSKHGTNRTMLSSSSCWDPNQYREVVRSTVTVMNFLGKVLMWGAIAATVAGVVWYSRELSVNGTDPHLVAWFSAGAFVILGFPISIYGIVMHLSNYYQPTIQCYVVRILWMVPIYSIESWLCLRFHQHAIYIETLRDFYESYVLYCFLQYLIEVLGGEEQLVLMLKDKSPTRGVHMSGLNWWIKPWIMGQPVGRRDGYLPLVSGGVLSTVEEEEMTSLTGAGEEGGGDDDGDDGVVVTTTTTAAVVRPIKRVQYTSPFFLHCKFGVLQYVILKFICTAATILLVRHNLYKEGDFTPKGGYLYVCIITNLSQCWALYCLVFFYYATKNELSVIRPVGKFLSVKSVVFFTWWQSLFISILFQMGMIPHYNVMDTGSGDDDAATMTGDGFWSAEDVAKGIQAYLICIEMFIGAIVHTFVFPHTDYLAPIGSNSGSGGRSPNSNSKSSYLRRSMLPSTSSSSSSGGSAAGSGGGGGGSGSVGKRLGRRGRPWNAALAHQYNRHQQHGEDRSACSKSSVLTPDGDVDLDVITSTATPFLDGIPEPMEYEGGALMTKATEERKQQQQQQQQQQQSAEVKQSKRRKEHPKQNQPTQKTIRREFEHEQRRQQQQQQRRHGFVRALIDSTMPRDVVDNTVGIVKGNFNVERQTLLHHAATSDEYDLFSKSSKRRRAASASSSTGVAGMGGGNGNGNGNGNGGGVQQPTSKRSKARGGKVSKSEKELN